MFARSGLSASDFNAIRGGEFTMSKIFFAFIFFSFSLASLKSHAELGCTQWSGNEPVAPCQVWSDGKACVKWSGNEPSAPCQVWSNGLACTKWSGNEPIAPCQVWSNGAACLKWSGNEPSAPCQVWSKRLSLIGR